MFVAGKKRKLASSASEQKSGTRGSRTIAGTVSANTSASSPSLLFAQSRPDGRASQSLTDEGAEAAKEASRLYAFGIENIKSKQYRNALDYCNRAIAVAKRESIRNAELFEARSLVLYKLEEYARAMDDAKDALRMDPKSATAYTYMANIMAATDRPREALEILERGLDALDPGGVSGYRHMEALRESLKRRIDPGYVPKTRPECDPVARLPSDINVIVFRELDIPSLIACRGVCHHWRMFIDTTPALWSRPCFSYPNAVDLLIQQMPAYAKPYKMAKQLVSCGQQRAVSGKALCMVFERSRETLRHLVVPEPSTFSARALDALFASKRPFLEKISIGSKAGLDATSFNRVLGWCLSGNISAIAFPYCELVTGKHMAAIVRLAPQLRSLDISGCGGLRVKQVFRAWGATLADAHDTTRLERLYINDHPEIPEFLVYSCKHRHFRGLRVLHMAIRSQRTFAQISGLGPLRSYFERIEDVQTPFPELLELNMDGVWDATLNSFRFASEFIKNLVVGCQLANTGLRRLSMLDATTARTPMLLLMLQRCLPTLRRLHLTRCSNLSSEVLLALTSDMAFDSPCNGPLQLTSLDLSGCAGASANGLAALISRCPNLVHVNLTQTAADNLVLGHLTAFVNTPETRGLEVVVLDTTDITGAAVRDFAAACAMRFKRLRRENGGGGLSSLWRLGVLDMDNCVGVGSDAVLLVRDLLSSMGTRVLAAVST